MMFFELLCCWCWPVLAAAPTLECAQKKELGGVKQNVLWLMTSVAHELLLALKNF